MTQKLAMVTKTALLCMPVAVGLFAAYDVSWGKWVDELKHQIHPGQVLPRWNHDPTGEEWEAAVLEYLSRLGYCVEAQPVVCGERFDVLATLSETTENTEFMKTEVQKRLAKEYNRCIRFAIECKDVPSRGVSQYHLYKIVAEAYRADAVPVIATAQDLPDDFLQMCSDWNVPVITPDHVWDTKPRRRWCHEMVIDDWLVPLYAGSHDLPPHSVVKFDQNGRQMWNQSTYDRFKIDYRGS